MQYGRHACAALCLLALVACESRQPAPAAAPATPKEVKVDAVTISANTQAEIEKLRIGVANVWEREFTDNAGKSRNGTTAQVWISHRDDEKLDMTDVVYPGKDIQVGQYRVHVTHVVKEGEGGLVRLEVWFK